MLTFIFRRLLGQPAHRHAWQHAMVEGVAHRVCPGCERHELHRDGAWVVKLAGRA